MSNPFYSAQHYPYHLPLAEELYMKLCQGIDGGRAHLLVQTVGIPREQINWQQALMYVWAEILDAAVRAKRLDALLDRVLYDNTLVTIHEVVRRVKAAGAVPGTRDRIDACDLTLLPGDLPFLDRTGLRAALRTMRESADLVRPILFVRGAPKSGKSSTLELIQVVAGSCGDEVIYFYEGNAPRVDRAVSHLLMRLKATPPARATTDEAWYADVCVEAIAKATLSGRRWWIVVDDLGLDPEGQPRMDPEVLTFFHQFALQMADPGFARVFRLVLLDYPRKPNHPPSKLRKTLLLEDFTLPFTEADVQAFAEAVLRKRQALHTATDLQQLVANLMEKAQQQLVMDPESSYGQALRDALSGWMGELR